MDEEDLIDESFPEPENEELTFSVSEELKNDVLTYYDAMFWMNSKLPSPDMVMERFSLTLESFNEVYVRCREPLANRGIKAPADPFNKPKPKLHPPVKSDDPDFELDPVFVVATSIICDSADKRSTAAKLKALGLTTKQWQAALKIPEHRAYFELRVKEAFEGAESASKVALAKNIESGDLQSIKYYNELTGRYRPQEESFINFMALISRFMEILSKRVEPAVLAEIADEFDAIIDIKEIANASSEIKAIGA